MSYGSVTFIFLQDPQPTQNDIENDNDPRIKRLSQLNASLNSISTVKWPNNDKLNHVFQGTVIGKPKFYIFDGDLCQSGGKYEWKDQFDQTPLTYAGGPQLAYIRYLFDNKWVPPSWFKSQMIRSNVDTVYFGLGNHDIQSTDHPNVPWLGFNLKFEGSHEGYFWYQMWNFICQMHTGLKTKDGEVPPRFLITGTIDDGRGTGNYHWTTQSFNYQLNFPSFSIIQLHRHGGDRMFGRNDRMEWLKEQLSNLGKTFPVIIVQHCWFNNRSQ
jgi:hypothetical protein